MTYQAKPCILDTLITSKTRVKLLLKFFLNSKTQSYLRGLENEFGESSNAIRQELNRFEDAGLLVSENKGNRKYFKANVKHPLFPEIHSLILKYTGVDKILDSILRRLGDLQAAYLIGDLSKGMESNVIDMVLVGHVDKEYLVGLVEKAEKLINKKVKYIIYAPEEFVPGAEVILGKSYLLLWNKL